MSYKMGRSFVSKMMLTGFRWGLCHHFFVIAKWFYDGFCHKVCLFSNFLNQVMREWSHGMTGDLATKPHLMLNLPI